MSPDAAIAAVTVALKFIIEAALAETRGLSAEVTSEHPEKVVSTGGSRVNVYLFQGQINPFMRNDDLIRQIDRNAKKAKGQVVQRWVTPLVLHYLISFYGDEKLLIPQRLMALTVAALHRHPDLTPRMLAAVANNEFETTPTRPEEDFEQVQLQMLNQSLDDMHKLWSALRASYTLSTMFEARSALVQSAPQVTDVDLVRKLFLKSINKRKPPEVPMPTGKDDPDPSG